jgi:hypothetical protein
MRFFLIAVLAIHLTLACTSCDGSTGGATRPSTASVTSTVPSFVSSPHPLVVAEKGVNGPFVFPNQITVGLANLGNVPDVCGFVASSSPNVSNVTQIVLIFGSETDPADVVGTGSYTMGDRLGVVLVVYDATCNSSGGAAVAATADITKITDTAIAGSFDLTFAAGQITGSFDAPLCNPPMEPDASSPAPDTDASSACVAYPSCSAVTGSGGPVRFFV